MGMVTVGTQVLNPLVGLQEYLGCQEVTGIPEELNIKKQECHVGVEGYHAGDVRLRRILFSRFPHFNCEIQGIGV